MQASNSWDLHDPGDGRSGRADGSPRPTRQLGSPTRKSVAGDLIPGKDERTIQPPSPPSRPNGPSPNGSRRARNAASPSRTRTSPARSMARWRPARSTASRWGRARSAYPAAIGSVSRRVRAKSAIAASSSGRGRSSRRPNSTKAGAVASRWASSRSRSSPTRPFSAATSSPSNSLRSQSVSTRTGPASASPARIAFRIYRDSGPRVAEAGAIPGVKNVLAVGSGKGGVGTSTMAAPIALGLKAHGASVGLMDADVYGPSIPHLLGASGRPMARGEQIVPIEAAGLRLMSMGFLLEAEQAVVMRGPMLHGIMQQFLRKVDWGELDYLVIDLPPGTGDVPLTLSQTLPLTGAVVVCTPQEVALLDAVRAIAMFRQLR
ncbi:hypothetical protein HK102_011458, partial [Quaeritorhiza haematococci]